MSTITISSANKDGPEQLTINSSGKSITVKYVFQDFDSAYAAVGSAVAGDVLSGYTGFYIQSVTIDGYGSADCSATSVSFSLVDDYSAAVGGNSGGGEEPEGTVVEDTWSLTWNEVSRPFLTAPRFNTQSPYGSVTMNSVFAYSMEMLTASPLLQRVVSVAVDGEKTTMIDLVQASIGADPRLRSEIFFVATDGDQVKFLKDVYAGLDKGQTDYKVWAPTITHSKSSSGSATVLGTVSAATIGFLNTPDTDFGLAADYEFLKTGDQIARTGRSGRWQRSETWQGALIGYGGWSKLTYKSGPSADWTVNPTT